MKTMRLMAAATSLVLAAFCGSTLAAIDWRKCVPNVPQTVGSPNYTMDVTETDGSGAIKRLTLWRVRCADNPVNSAIIAKISPVTGRPTVRWPGGDFGMMLLQYGGITQDMEFVTDWSKPVFSGVVTSDVYALVKTPDYRPAWDTNEAFTLRYTSTRLYNFVTVDFAPSYTTYSVDVDGMWFNANESGWGASIVLGETSERKAFVVLYVYADGHPMWFVMSGGTWAANGVLTGDLYSTTGSDFRAGGWDRSAFHVNPVGTASIAFKSPTEGTLAYTVNGMNVTKSITRQRF